MMSLHAICGLPPPQSKILATPMHGLFRQTPLYFDSFLEISLKLLPITVMLFNLTMSSTIFRITKSVLFCLKKAIAVWVNSHKSQSPSFTADF